MKLFNADCIETLKELEENSIDSIVTDPPYFINFMGKKWDAQEHIAAHPDFWKECLRVLKPGGHCLAFGHSRTHHRLFTAIEDAGFTIKDTIMWMYGSGFPKSHNIGKSVQKKLGKAKVIGKKKGAGTTGSSYVSNNPDYKDGDKGVFKKEYNEIEITNEWEGWGTALKPAYEPICLAQKPKEGTYADNVLKHNVGGINIDASRVGSTEDFSKVKPRTMMTNQGSVKKTEREGGNHNHSEAESLQEAKNKLQTLGRFPANLILSHHPECKVIGEAVELTSNHNAPKGTFAGGEEDRGSEKIYREQENKVLLYECVEDCPCKTIDKQSGVTKSSPNILKEKYKDNAVGKNTGFSRGNDSNYTDKGGASRFFKQIGVNQKTDETLSRPHNEHKGEHLRTMGKFAKFGNPNSIADKLGRFPANLILSHHDDCEQVGVGHETMVGGNKGKSGFAQGYESGDFTKQEKVYPIYKCVDGCPIKELDTQAPKVGNAYKATRKKDTTGGSGDSWTTDGKKEGEDNGVYDGLAGASRFFYCAKSGKKERNKYMSEDAPVKSAETRTPTGAGVYAEKGFNPPRRNYHPTIKPLKLMNYLIKLITPPGGIVLDPFMGSGSTGIAAIEGGWNFMGIEREEEYFEIAEQRLQECKEKTT